ncbi:MAG TPA: RagB/SusD family nutrient uptake outer membrane protein [Dinghuibacter sp.]|uniref:RagB/SusD family nutrient uptake outer membrane protein n=1 Tax=Dinghuibacter sp. TaxID=2024697 RepID=UPI002BCE7CB7|nr:RagB/SusD family nutrient uptake outer membrane protein [Dinghuibacter sp.]HTJ12067.1 RagB/SusD family nutrient uptake outer membrane protein [Dinghuibacter sp.]
MKKYIWVSLLILAGCKKDLDIPNPNALTTEQFWKTSTDAQQGVNSIYSTFHRTGLCRWIHFITIIRSDEGYSTSPNTEIINNWDVFNITDYNWGNTVAFWDDNYIGIDRCNQVLDNVPGIDMDATLRTQLIGEAHFMRGFFYYTLATLWGNVPILLHTSVIGQQPPTSSQDSVFAQAEQDFTEAAGDLPVSYDAGNVGRATKGAAYGMLGKCYMQTHQYAQAQQALAYLVTGGGAGQYSLVPNYRSNFIETSENNAESVFEVQNALNPNDTHDDDTQIGTSDNLNYGTSIPPFFAPRPIGFTDGQARRWPVAEFLSEATVAGGRDPRLAATYLYDSTDPRGPDYTMVYGRTFSSLGYSSDPTVVPNTHDVYFRKFLDDSVMTGEVFHSGNNWRYLRYADVLLLYAEALNAQGSTATAYPFVDAVRQRAGLAPLSTVKPGLSQADFLTQLKHERLVELCGEGHRWEDLARWGDLSSALSSRDPSFAHFKTGRDEFLPIPQFDLDLNPNLRQNPGY